MSDCSCEVKTDSPAQRQVLSIALGLNATMFVVGLAAGLIGQSSGLIADSLDMFADAVAYGIALSAFNRGAAFKARAAMMSGGVLLILGVGVLLDTARRGVFGSAPESRVMIGVASISLQVNDQRSSVLPEQPDRQAHVFVAAVGLPRRFDYLDSREGMRCARDDLPTTGPLT